MKVVTPVTVFISHADEDIQRCAPLLRALDAWQVSYYFDALDRRASQSLSLETQQALVECEILLRICTRSTARSYWMSIEVGAFLSLQADDHKANQPERRKMVNLILDPQFKPEPFDISATAVDATNARWPGWVNDLRRALDLSPVQDVARIAQEINPPPTQGMTRRAVVGLGASGAAAIAAGVGIFWLARNDSSHAAPSPTPTPPSRDSRLLWWFSTRSPGQQTTGSSSISGAVAVEGNAVYAATHLGMVYAISLTGNQLWRYSLGQGAAIYQRPVVAANVVYVNGHNLGVAAIQNGERLWLHASAGFTESVPVLADNRLYVNALDLNLVSVTALDVMTGATVIDYALNPFSVPVSGVAVTGGVLIFGAQDGYLYALDVATPTSPPRWRVETGAARQAKVGGAASYYVSALPTVVDGIVYAGSTDNNLYAIDVATGAKRWAFSTGGSITLSSAAVAHGVVYVGSEDHKLYAIDAARGTLLWSYSTGSSSISSPAVANGAVYVGSGDRAVYALDARTGALKHTYRTAGTIIAQPTVSTGTLYAADSAGFVYAFALV